MMKSKPINFSGMACIIQVFSFKLRGAYNKMTNLSSEELAKGVICSSAGNHAQGVALSAKKLVGWDLPKLGFLMMNAQGNASHDVR